MTNSIKCGIYARRSVEDEEAEDWVSRSVQDQLKDCHDLAAQLGWEVVETYPEDATSAWKKRKVTLPNGHRVMRNVRPTWLRMLDDLYHGRIDALVAYDLDRAMREPRDLEDLIEIIEQLHRRVESVTGSLRLSNDTEILAARVNCAVANKSSRDTSRRVARGARRRAEGGQWHGGRVAPLGYELVKDWVETKKGMRERVTGLRLDDHYTPLMRDAAKRLLRGESLYSICAEWNAAGITTRDGARWVSATLRRALISPSAIGRREHDGTLYETGWPELLDRQTWDRLHDLFGDPGRRLRPASGSYTGKHALGGGVTICGNIIDEATAAKTRLPVGSVCGKKLVSQVHRGKPRIICATAVTGGCGHVLISYEPLERFVLDMLLARLDSPEWHAALSPRQTDTTDQEKALRDELADLDGQRRRVGDAVVVGAYTKAEATEKVREIEDQQDRIRRRLSGMAADLVRAEIHSAEDARKLWDNADTQKRRRFLQSFIEAVVVKPLPAGRATNLTPRREESAEEHRQRNEDNQRAILRERVAISWRR